MKNRKLSIIVTGILIFTWLLNTVAAEGYTLPDQDGLSAGEAVTEQVSPAEEPVPDVESAEIIPDGETGEEAELFSEVKGSCGDKLTWILNDGGRLTISGSGDMDDMIGADSTAVSFGSAVRGMVPWYDLREEITSVFIGNGVTGIGNSAFIGCVNLREISVPDSVARIGSAAFSGCESLQSIRVPDRVTTIGKGAFNGCSALTQITLPSALTVIEDNTFSGCDSLKAVTVPQGVSSIGVNAFARCGSLNQVSIPGSVTSIGSSAFSYCAGLTEVSIPGSTASIGTSAFAHCDRLAKVTIGNGVTTIESRAWEGCGSLTAMTIPASVTSIGSYVWTDCPALVSLSTASGNQAYSSRDGVLFSADGSELILCPPGKQGEYVIPTGVKSVRSYAFLNCSRLTRVTVSAGVTVIGAEAFRDCSALTGITLPEGVTSIQLRTFENCSALSSLSLPDSVTEIGSWAFMNCGSLKEVVLPEKLSSLSIAAFGSCSALEKVTVPAGIDNLNFHYIFINCGSLNRIEIHSDNKSFSSTDGVVFSKNHKTLVYYPEGRRGSYSIPSGVTLIGDSAFEFCNGLTGVVIPNTVTEIEAEAFTYCGILTSVTVPDTVTVIGSGAFSYCESLTGAVLSKNVETLETGLFQGCTNLKSVSLSNKVSTIGEKVFFGCSSLTDFSIPASVTTINSYAFANCTALTTVDIPEKVTGISFSNCYSGCSSLQTITVSQKNSSFSSAEGLVLSRDGTELYYCPEGRTGSCSVPHGVNSIGAGSFSDCTKLTEVILPDGVKTIGDYAFHNCSSLSSVVMPDSLRTIGTVAFGECSGLIDIIIPDGVTSIGSYAFSGCSSLVSAEIPDTMSVIPERAFQDCVSLTDMRFPASIETIGKSAFNNCAGLTSVSIPEGVSDIQASAFQFCSSLTDVSLPDSMKSLGIYSFSGCSSLTGVTIPNSNASIGRCSFKDCSSLRDVFYGGTEAQWNEKGDITAHKATLFSSEDYDNRMETSVRLENVPGGVAVTMTSSGNQIFYTLDGSIPGTAAIPYEGAFLLDEAGEYFINARAFDLGSGKYGEITTEYLQLEQSAAPSVRESGGRITLTAEGNVYYTLDVSEIPTVDDRLYTEPLQFADTTCIRARTIESGKAPSEVINYVWYKPEGTGYTFTDDSYQFENNRASFGYTGSTYRIPYERYEEVFGKSFGEFLYDIYGSISWGGSCFGLSATSLMFSRNLLPLRDYSENAEKVYDLLAPVSKDSSLTKLIERYQIAQFSDEVMQERDDPSEGGTMVLSGQNGNGQEGAALIDAVRNACSGGNMIVLILWRQNLDGSHAVIPYRMDDRSIYVYDCNEPGKEKKIGYSVNEKGVYRFSYEQYSYAISFNRLTTLLESIENIESGASLLAEKKQKMLVSVNSKDITVLDEQGQEVKTYLRYRTVDDAETDSFVFSVPVGTYTIYNHDESIEKLILSAATDQDYYSITVNDPAAGVELSEKYGRLAMKVQEDHPVGVQCRTSNASGRENVLALESSSVMIYACTDRAVLINSASETMVSNGRIMSLQQKDQDDGLFISSVSSAYTQKAQKAYSGNRGITISTDIASLPGTSFALTVYVTGAPDSAALYAAAYTRGGRQKKISKSEIENGRKKYVFNIGADTEEVRLFLLEKGSMKPLSSVVEIR